MKNLIRALLILSLLILNFLNGVDLDVQTEGNITSYTNKADAVSYTSNKNNQAFITKLSETYHGLSNERQLEDLLRQQNYIEVLNYLWTEPDANKRLAWLERKIPASHPILMFELAEEYYLQNPSLTTYLNKTMPWLLASARRTTLDIDTTSDTSVGAAPGFLLSVYQERILEDLQKKHSEKEIEKYISDNTKSFQKNNIIILKRIMEPIAHGQTRLPSPEWIYAHSLGSVISRRNNIPESQYDSIRKRSAQEYLDKIKELEKSLNK